MRAEGQRRHKSIAVCYANSLNVHLSVCPVNLSPANPSGPSRSILWRFNIIYSLRNSSNEAGRSAPGDTSIHTANSDIAQNLLVCFEYGEQMGVLFSVPSFSFFFPPQPVQPPVSDSANAETLKSSFAVKVWIAKCI